MSKKHKQPKRRRKVKLPTDSTGEPIQVGDLLSWPDGERMLVESLSLPDETKQRIERMVHDEVAKCLADIDIVRCRDCKHFERGGTLTVAGHEHKMLNHCHRHTYDGGYTCICPDEDNYCSWGERRAEQ